MMTMGEATDGDMARIINDDIGLTLDRFVAYLQQIS